MCFGLGLMSKLTGSSKVAKATAKAADKAAANDRLAAQAAQQTQEATIAQSRAAEQAAAVLSRPIEEVAVQVGETGSNDVDPTTGRRRTPRSRFQMGSASSGSGLSL